MPCTLLLLGKKGAKNWPKVNNIIFDTVHFFIEDIQHIHIQWQNLGNYQEA